MGSLIPTDYVERRIYLIRGQRVMLDRDLAFLFDVPTGRLNEQVSRNLRRFPSDFMFQLTTGEADSLRSQNAILKRGQHRKYLPRAFTEHGIAMLSGVLKSRRAVDINIEIVRAFIRLRRVLAENLRLGRRLEAHERRLRDAEGDIQTIFEAIERLESPPPDERRKIGFKH